MRQLVYISSAKRQAAIDPEAILAESRRNNAAAGVTGLLFYNGKRFLQALEGDSARIEATFERIRSDDRHHAIVVLSDRSTTAREFGDWAMAYAVAGEDREPLLERITALTAQAVPSVRATFEGFATIRHAG